jgi:hypothetical protein
VNRAVFRLKPKPGRLKRAVLQVGLVRFAFPQLKLGADGEPAEAGRGKAGRASGPEARQVVAHGVSRGSAAP